MSEEEFINRIINQISKDYGGVMANELKYIIIRKDKEIDRLNNAIKEIKEKIDDYFAYDYENESQARLDTLNEINHIIVNLEMKGDDK